jgi:hypothetical protein
VDRPEHLHGIYPERVYCTKVLVRGSSPKGIAEHGAGLNRVEFVLVVEPFIVVFVEFFILPFILFFVPVIVLHCGAVCGRIGNTTRVGVELHRCGRAVAFIQKYAIGIMTFDTGHFHFLLGLGLSY